MVAVLKGDIIGSRQIEDAGTWLKPLKQQLSQYGRTPKKWEIAWGDAFQLELGTPASALSIALQLQACIRSLSLPRPLGLRIAIGIGHKTYNARHISQSNGPAFVHAGTAFEEMQAQKSIMMLHTPWPGIDEQINLMLRLANIQIGSWTIAAATLMALILAKPDITQKELGAVLGIDQSSVSGRWQRASGSEIMALAQYFSKIINKQLS